jgi:hypothetical protein
MTPHLPRDWSAPPRKSWPPVGAEDFSVYAVRRYALHAELGAGSVATVHLARLRGPDGFARTVAVKRLRPQYAKDPELVAMLLDGARLAARVRHPNVVPALDVVTGDELLVVTEYVHGESLASLLRTLRGRDAQAPLPIVSGIFAGILRGVHAVTEARAAAGGAPEASADRPGLGRHDVSPQDILVGVDGIARLIDLGVGRAESAASAVMRASTSVTETLDDASEGRADRFAVATILWEAVAGRTLLPRISPEGFEPPSRYRPEVSPELDAVVAKGLARAAGSAFDSARDMALALEAAAAPATPSEIGLWVESLARPALDERARLLARAESAPPVVRAAVPSRPEPQVAESLAAPEAAPTRPDPSAELVTRRERGLVPSLLGTKRGLGVPDGGADSEEAFRALASARRSRRALRVALFAGAAVAATIAVVCARRVLALPQAPGTLAASALPAAGPSAEAPAVPSIAAATGPGREAEAEATAPPPRPAPAAATPPFPSSPKASNPKASKSHRAATSTRDDVL